MMPARRSQRLLGQTKLLVLDPEHAPQHSLVQNLPDFLESGDLLVINRSATLPSSFSGSITRSGEAVEIRLASFQGAVATDLRHWAAFAFGAGDWRMPTEERGPPPRLQAGDLLDFGAQLRAIVLEVKAKRFLQLLFQGADLEAQLYAAGRPIQYSYLEEDLAIWDQQTIFAGPPLSTEAPSAAFPFTWDLVLQLKKRGIDVATLLHGAGISSAGSASLDALLPLPEYYDVPAATMEKVERALQKGGRIIALGTSALRALESAAMGPRQGMTELRLGAERVPRLAHGLITGMHELGSSHRQLLAAFLPEARLSQAYDAAEQEAYRSHEYGDICLIFGIRSFAKDAFPDKMRAF